MIVYFCNDTSSYHAGSAAVSNYIKDCLASSGHTVLVEEDRTIVELDRIEQCDAVVVNGEGTMHHNNPRALHLLKLIEQGQNLGKSTALVNSVWQQMEKAPPHVLQKLDTFIVREALSAQAVKKEFGLTPTVKIDFSYWAHPPQNSRSTAPSGIAVTDVFSTDLGCFAWPSGGWFHRIDGPKIDLKNSRWEEVCNTLSHSKLLVTGRHHAVYAACVAHCPFVSMRGNTHKIEGLMATADVQIPVAKSFGELHELSANAPSNSLYEKLFDWMEAQTPWDGV